MSQLIAYHGDPKIKAKYLKRVQAHAKADQIVHGVYWQDGKGCAVGCTIHSSNHARFERELGIPETIALLEDNIFEGLSNGDAQQFPLQFLKAIQPGADLTLIWPRFAIWLLTDERHGVKQYASPDGQMTIDKIVALYQRVIAGKHISVDTWRNANAAAAAYAANAAANAANAAYAYAYAAAANAAAANAAAYAANAAAAAAYAAAANAAAYAANAAAAYAARIEFWQAARDQLLKLLVEAPINQ